MKQHGRMAIVSLVLALAILLGLPTQALAAGETQYVSDIQVGYGDSGKMALYEADYTVWKNLNANDGGEGSAVWIGYKTTTNPDEAITDMAVMNMKGGYSFQAYADELEEISNNVTAMLNAFQAAIEEFRVNYEAGSPWASAALGILNQYYDDDSQNAKIGDLILDENTSEETLHTIFMQGNTENLNVIENALALGCTEWQGETFLDRLAEAEYTDELDPAMNQARGTLLSVFEDFRQQVISAEEINKKLESEEIDEDEMPMDMFYIGLYQVVTETDYGDTGLTLYDVAMLPQEDDGEAEIVLDDELINVLASCMTAGQLGVVSNVGLGTLIGNAYGTKDEVNGKAENIVSQIVTEATKDMEEISVYAGVDRSLFSDTDTVALTSAALRENAKSQNGDFGVLQDSNAVDEKTRNTMITLAAVSGAIGITALAIGISIIKTGYTYVLGTIESTLVEGVWKASFSATTKTLTSCCFGNVPAFLGPACTALGCVCIVASIVLTIVTLLKFINKPKTIKIEYTAIPRALVDLRYDEKNNKQYCTYYAAKLVTAAEEDTDSLGLYGDLNALNGKNEWVVLYYTKDSKAGNPITPNMLVRSDTAITQAQEKAYSPIHEFGSTAAANLNQYNTGENAKPIYVYLKTTSTANSQIGSAFTSGNIVTMLVMLLVGGAIGAITAVCVVKRKKKTVNA